MVDSCMGDKRNTQDINCGGLRKNTTFYSWLTVVWETKEMVDSCMGDKRNTQDINCGGLRERYYVLFMVDSCMGDKRNTQDINCGGLRKDTEFYMVIHG